MYVITAHQRHGQTDRRTDGRTSSDPMTATLLKHVAVKSSLLGLGILNLHKTVIGIL